MPGFWRHCRIAFRWTRYLVWLLVVLALLALAWANVVGIPQFLQDKIAVAMREHGVPVEFSRMRWRFIHGIVAENVIVGEKLNRADRPLLTAGQIQLRLNYGALLKSKFELSGVVLHGGILTLPFSPTNRLEFLNLQAEVRFLPDETWSLDELRADFSGARFLISGAVAHAPDAMDWDLFAGKKNGGHGAVANSLQNFADTLAKIRFTAPPQINAQIEGDARDVHSFALRLNADVPQVDSPWFAARGLQIAASLSAPAGAMTNFDDALDFWTNALPFQFTWTTRAAELEFTNFSGSTIECSGEWSAPKLSVTKISAQAGGGKLDASAQLDVATRELFFTNHAAFDPRLLQPLLPAAAGAQLDEIFWTQPPFLALEGTVTLPAWTNRAPEWREVLNPTARLQGEFAATNAVVRGQTVELARARFSYADFIWRAPDFQFSQGRTRLAGGGEFSTATENFRGALRGDVAAATVRPFLPADILTNVFDLFTLAEPVVLNLTAAGNLREAGSLTATGRVALADVAIRGQAYESASSDFSYAGRVLYFLHPQSSRAHGTQVMTADAVVLDWNAGMYFFTNGFSTTDPMAVVRCIGPKTAAMIEPYEFLSPPVARVHGQLPLRNLTCVSDLAGTDMTFEITGGAPFRWTRLNTTNITGIIHWQGRYLVLTNAQAAFYGGAAAGHAFFDFLPSAYGCDFNFAVDVTNVDVGRLANDLADSGTNVIEGSLSGRAVVTEGKSETWRSWNGRGHAELRDGLLWNVPVFGFLSPALNKISPGLGNNRATDAAAHFAMTNGVIHTDSLDIHTRTMLLNYVGTVDLGGEVNAHVTAQLLKNMPVVGSLVSFVLTPVSKIFECQVRGPVTSPQVTPIYIPFTKYIFSPVRSLEDMFPADRPRG